MTQKPDSKVYQEILYFAKRISESGGQPVSKKLVPDGPIAKLDPSPSLKLNDHCPDFNWGYGGSGSAQLALALLLDATTDPELSLANYQQFKEEKVACWGGEWAILRSEILTWIEQLKTARLKAMANRN